jgi:hypothetical protein
MNVLSAIGDGINLAGRVTGACVKMPLRFVNRLVVRPVVINVEIGLISAGTRLSEVAHYCAHELRKAYLAAPHDDDFRLKLRLRDQDILWDYPVSSEDRRKVERKLVRLIKAKIGSNLSHVESEVNQGSIEITFAPTEPLPDTTST